MLSAESCFREGSYFEAMDIYQAILRDERIADFQIMEAKYRLIHVYYRVGDLNKALRVSEELEAFDPDYRDLKSLKYQIEKSVKDNSGLKKTG